MFKYLFFSIIFSKMQIKTTRNQRYGMRVPGDFVNKLAGHKSEVKKDFEEYTLESLFNKTLIADYQRNEILEFEEILKVLLLTLA